MSDYIKTEWKNGDIITAEKLNNIEDGIANNSENACKCNGPTITIHQSGFTFTADPIAPGLSLEAFAKSTVLVDRVVEGTSNITCVASIINAYQAPFNPAGKTVYIADITIFSTETMNKKDLQVDYDLDTGEISVSSGEAGPQ